MKCHSESRRGRTGFTLVELLTVIAIIAILASMTTAAVMAIIKETDNVTARNDISQLANSLGTFKTAFKGLNPPSKLYLGPDVEAVDPPSAAFLQAMFPLAKLSTLNWSGKGWLEGDQVLVFLLQGPPTADGSGQGFSKNPTNPAAPKAAAAESRIGPFYEFPTARLKKLRGDFYSFIDPWETKPYAFFSSGRVPNGYKDTDCASLGVAPYKVSIAPVPAYHNANSFQIICAGRDQTFGTGGVVWNTDKAEQIDPKGRDDMTNFHGKPMGTP